MTVDFLLIALKQKCIIKYYMVFETTNTICYSAFHINCDSMLTLHEADFS